MPWDVPKSTYLVDGMSARIKYAGYIKFYSPGIEQGEWKICPDFALGNLSTSTATTTITTTTTVTFTHDPLDNLTVAPSGGTRSCGGYTEPEEYWQSPQPLPPCNLSCLAGYYMACVKRPCPSGFYPHSTYTYPSWPPGTNYVHKQSHLCFADYPCHGCDHIVPEVCTCKPGTSTTTTTATSNSITLTAASRNKPTVVNAKQAFEPVGKHGYLGACRGSHYRDDRPSYYIPHTGINSLCECQALCINTPECKAIEYGKGRCEVWTRVPGEEVYTVYDRPFSMCFRYVAAPARRLLLV